ncbi:hypothetical protein [Vitreoscilla stercoraria]|uniref:RecT family protein n=1 Tax=Vitreoscilla stercoraria TaxID=61 RepID=A0ABY4EC82_VITST|nr:hypothetical protein [Vitreoscilla stercoraria]UOO93355.1 hypothetical protein LVJ81_04830 [Vitreoscilla stercoraria]
MTQIQTTASLLQPSTQKTNATVGFFDFESFELTQRMAKMFASSSLVPAQFRKSVEKYNNQTRQREWVENPEAIANCCIALDMAARLNANPIMVMQNLYVIEGRPSWSSQWIIACINRSGRFTPLQFRIEDKGEQEVQYEESAWVNGKKQSAMKKATIRNLVCVAHAKSLETGETVESAPISMELAVKEGWYGKNGSKWQTMPEMMLRYRAASFFGRIYAPDLLMGFSSQEEAEEMAYIETMPSGEVVEETTKVAKGKMKKAEAVAALLIPDAAAEAEAEAIAQQITSASIQSNAPEHVDTEHVDTQTDEVLYNTGPLSNPDQYPVNPDDDDIFAGTGV